MVAVGGIIKISNNVHFRDAMRSAEGMGRNAIINMQILEYSRGFLGTGYSRTYDANLIISVGYGLSGRTP